MRSWNYAVAAGDTLNDEWDAAAFAGSCYHLRVYGPNGFYREFKGDAANPALSISLTYEQTGNAVLNLINAAAVPHKVTVTDMSYNNGTLTRVVPAGSSTRLAIKLDNSHHWYDLEIKVDGCPNYTERFAGRVETGSTGKTDPLMGGVV